MTHDEIMKAMLYWHVALRDEFEERAAIYEFEGKLTRAESELRAYRDVLVKAGK